MTVTPMLGVSHHPVSSSLNSRQLTAAHIWHIAGAMQLPSTGSADEVRQLIEVKLGDEREVRNVCASCP